MTPTKEGAELVGYLTSNDEEIMTIIYKKEGRLWTLNGTEPIGVFLEDMIADQQRQLVDRVIEGLPKKDNWIADHYESDGISEDATSEQYAYNETIDQVIALLNKIRRELDG